MTVDWKEWRANLDRINSPDWRPGRRWLTVLTTPSRTGYLPQTLRLVDDAGAALLRRAGFLRTVVCVDAAQADHSLYNALIPAGWDIISVGGKGTRRAMHKIAQLAVGAEAPGLLYLEDDVAPCRNAVIGAFAIAGPPSGCGFLTLCDVRSLAGADPSPPRIVARAADDPKLAPGFWGTQAILFTHSTLDHLASRTIAGNDYPFASDVWLGQHCASAGAPWRFFGALAPSLFQHIGATSSINGTWKLDPHRVAASFRPDIDAQAVAAELLRADPFTTLEQFALVNTPTTEPF